MATKGMFFTACVLAFAATAGAGLQFMVDDQVVHSGAGILTYPPTIFSLANDKEETVGFEGGAVALDAYSEFGEVTIIQDMLPNGWSILDISADFGRPALFITSDVPAVDPFKAGKLIDFEIIWKFEATVEFYDVSLEPVFSVTLFTPEPATLALLGLGVMMIRRR